MPTRRARARRPEPARSKLRRVERWAGLRSGDPVEVVGLRQRSATWTFLAHVTNADTGDAWVEVVGGAKGDRRVRSFDPSRIFAPGAGKSGRLSLAEEPQLPLG
jgi:hypothetical protein